MEDQDLTEAIIGYAMRVHGVLGAGYLESVYQKALSHELIKVGLSVECEKPIVVHYDGIAVGDFFCRHARREEGDIGIKGQPGHCIIA